MGVLRTIEKRIRRLTLALLTPGRSGAPGQGVKFDLPDRPSILLIRIDRIGDAIVSTPAVRLLKKHFPESRVDILLGEKNRITAPMFPYVDNSYVLEKGLRSMISTVRTLRSMRYDLVVNLHLNRSASASSIGGLVRTTTMIEYPEEHPFRTESEAGRSDPTDRHVVSMTSQLLEPIGIEPIHDTDEQDNALEVLLDDTARSYADGLRSTALAGSGDKKVVFMNVTASHSSRRWPPEMYADLAGRLRETGFASFLCGAPGDEEILKRIRSLSNDACSIIEPVSRYPNFVAGLGLADIVVTPDTSTVHAAAAMGTAVVVLYTHLGTATAWSPWGVPHRALSNPNGMTGITVPEVLDAVTDLGAAATAEQQGAFRRPV